MLLSLHIKNYAIIDEVTLDFPSSLTTITGETGSGKSILLGALGLILGNRADTDKLFNKEQKCVVEAHFKVNKQQVGDFFENYDYDYEDDLILRREINSNGKSRAFINDTPALLKELRALSKTLIQQHQQFDTMEIVDASYQLRLVDSLADHGNIMSDYRSLYTHQRTLLSRIATLQEAYDNASKQQDYIAFQLREIEELNMQRVDVENLDEEFTQLQHADEIIELLSSIIENLNGGNSGIVEKLRTLRSAIIKLDDYLPEGGEIIQRLETAMLEIEDISHTSFSLRDNIDSDPTKLMELHKKVDKLQALMKKHQLESYEDVFKLKEELEAKLSSIEYTDTEIHKLEEELIITKKKLLSIAGLIRNNRNDVIPGLEQQVKNQLKLLAMPHAQFKIALEPLEEPGLHGMDKAEFLFNANKGGELHNLKYVASGGEMSRLALVLSSLVAKSMTLPTMIFDEIDSGVSGDVALKMGKILKSFSEDHQVIVITHSPQIAAQGNTHYYVYKRVDDERTYAVIEPVRDDERINKIAIMLSQNPPSEAARRNAEELLNYKFN